MSAFDSYNRMLSDIKIYTEIVKCDSENRYGTDSKEMRDAQRCMGEILVNLEKIEKSLKSIK